MLKKSVLFASFVALSLSSFANAELDYSKFKHLTKNDIEFAKSKFSYTDDYFKFDPDFYIKNSSKIDEPSSLLPEDDFYSEVLRSIGRGINFINDADYQESKSFVLHYCQEYNDFQYNVPKSFFKKYLPFVGDLFESKKDKDLSKAVDGLNKFNKRFCEGFALDYSKDK